MAGNYGWHLRTLRNLDELRKIPKLSGLRKEATTCCQQPCRLGRGLQAPGKHTGLTDTLIIALGDWETSAKTQLSYEHVCNLRKLRDDKCFRLLNLCSLSCSREEK